jgi:hypothetical protein
MSQRAMDTMRRGAQKRLDAAGGGGGGAGGAVPAGGVRGWLTEALRITGHYSPENLRALYGRAMQESGGDPKIQNNWDSNARKGTPSIGLLQTIGPTFDAHKLPGMGNIRHPVHNAVAAIRYMFSRYGRIVGPSGSGYALGGRLGPDYAGAFRFGGSFDTRAGRGALFHAGEGGRRERVSVRPLRPRGRPAGRAALGGVNLGGVHFSGPVYARSADEVAALGEKVADVAGKRLLAALSGDEVPDEDLG